MTTEAPARRTFPKRKPARRRAMRRYATVALFMSPWIVGFIVFVAYPMVASAYYSFTNYDLLTTPRMIGLENYRFMFTKDPEFWQAMRNTLWIILVGLPLNLAFSLVTAMLLTRPRRGHRVYRTIFSCRRSRRPVAAALAFVFLFNPSFGPVNQILHGIGDQGPAAVVLRPVDGRSGGSCSSGCGASGRR